MSKKLTIDFIRKQFKQAGYTLLTSEYINNKQKLDCVCSEGHKYVTTWDMFHSGRRCPICKAQDASKRLRTDVNIVRGSFEREGFILLTKEYRNNSQRLEYICPNGHYGHTTWHSWQCYKSCKRCSAIKDSKKRKINFSYIQEFSKKIGYGVLSKEKEYSNIKSKLEFKCSNDHEFIMCWNDLSQGHGCPVCAKKHTKPEIAIFNFVKSYFPDTIHNDRKVISPKELDIVVPSKKIAVEYCGLYWHSELLGKDKKYHLNKLKKAKEKGYRLITIFEDEYLNHKEVVLDRLKNILGVSDAKKLNARDCTIKEIDAKIAKEFCDKYHLQGYGNSRVKLGAFINDDLLSVMTFSKPNIAKGKNNIDNSYELNRFCSKVNYNIRGIASKFLKHFLKAYSPEIVYSYADKRWSDGGLYEALGFKHLYDSEPNYWYLEQQKRVHRFNFRKDILKSKLEDFDAKLSEWQNMINNGYNRIWDCGNMKYALA